MLDRVAAAGPAAGVTMMTVTEARAAAAADPAMATLLAWVENYLMAAHPDLGRTGAVCPFTKQAAKIDTVRLAISHAGPDDEEEVFALIRGGFAELETIPCKPAMRHFRTIIVGFPNCLDDDGVAMLKRVQKRNRFHSLARTKMIGMMYAKSEDPGLWNPEFRPLRSPLPVLAIRHMVEQDAPFAAKHPLLAIPYLLKFPISGTRRLFTYFRSGG